MQDELIYDLETYPNFFSGVFRHYTTGNRWIFEVSDRMNHAQTFLEFLFWCESNGVVFTGFNNLGFDYPVLNEIMLIGPGFTAAHAYNKATAIIRSTDRFSNLVKPWEIRIPQIDLYKIHHFDNRAKTTSLKMLEFNMRADNIGDLPFPPGTILTDSQMTETLIYNCHDVDETKRFREKSTDKIDFRKQLTRETEIDMTNFNDTKIGKKFFEIKLEEHTPGICGTSSNPNQTIREKITINDIIFPYVQFNRPEFQRVLKFFKATVLTETKALPEFKNLSANIDGFQFDFGTGGIHGSVHRRVVHASETHDLIDADVTSYYPSLAIKNRLFPEHLSEQFCDIYENLFLERRKHKKGTPKNAALKLALNGTYGASNDVYSPFYDPQFTMSITINGQLLLCMLAEWLMSIPGLTMIQINTDGMTCLVPKHRRVEYDQFCKYWQQLTKLDLEFADYNTMWIRDCNNYIAQYTDGKLKRKGKYEYKLDWHQNFSALVVPKVAEKVMVNGGSIMDCLMNHADGYDFFLRAKSTGQSYHQIIPEPGAVGNPCGLYFTPSGGEKKVYEPYPGEKLQKITRYYIAKDGGYLQKIMPPLATKPERGWRRFAVHDGWKIAVCDRAHEFNPGNLNLEWYAQEIEKILIR